MKSGRVITPFTLEAVTTISGPTWAIVALLLVLRDEFGAEVEATDPRLVKPLGLLASADWDALTAPKFSIARWRFL